MQAVTATLYFHGRREPESLADPHCLQLYFAINREILDPRGGGYKNDCFYTIKCFNNFSHAELQPVVSYCYQAITYTQNLLSRQEQLYCLQKLSVAQVAFLLANCCHTEISDRKKSGAIPSHVRQFVRMPCRCCSKRRQLQSTYITEVAAIFKLIIPIFIKIT